MPTKSNYQLKPNMGELQYMGVDPLNPKQNLRIQLKDMTAQQLEAWVQLNPKTALKYVDGATPIAPKRDNQPKETLPSKPVNLATNDEKTTAKATTKAEKIDKQK